MKLIKLLFRLILLPISLLTLLLTAILEGARLEPDWEYWKQYNKTFIELLPWSKL